MRSMRPDDRTAVHVAIEHAHENGNARQRPVAEIKFLRRRGVGDAADAAIGRRHHDALARRRHPLRIAEEIGAPERRQRRQPAERRPQPKQNQADERDRRRRRDSPPDGWARAASGWNRGRTLALFSSVGVGPGASASAGRSSSTSGGLRLGATISSSTSARSSRAFSASR